MSALHVTNAALHHLLGGSERSPYARRRTPKLSRQTDDGLSTARDDRGQQSLEGRRHAMYRQARERIITAEIRKLERRRASEDAARPASNPPASASAAQPVQPGERCPTRR
jgi:hypothetical protein